ASFQRSADLAESVLREKPGDLKAATAFARATLGLNSSAQDDLPLRDGHIQRVIAVMDEAARKQPLEPAAQVVLAQAWFVRSEVEMERQRLNESLQARQRSIGILREVLASHPDDGDAARWLATSEKR